MAKVIIRIEDDDENVIAESIRERTMTELTTAINAFAAAKGYQACIYDVDGNSSPNPESKADFMIRLVKEYQVNEINGFILKQAVATAKANAVLVSV